MGTRGQMFKQQTIQDGYLKVSRELHERCLCVTQSVSGNAKVEHPSPSRGMPAEQAGRGDQTVVKLSVAEGYLREVTVSCCYGGEGRARLYMTSAELMHQPAIGTRPLRD